MVEEGGRGVWVTIDKGRSDDADHPHLGYTGTKLSFAGITVVIMLGPSVLIKHNVHPKGALLYVGTNLESGKNVPPVVIMVVNNSHGTLCYYDGAIRANAGKSVVGSGWNTTLGDSHTETEAWGEILETV